MRLLFNRRHCCGVGGMEAKIGKTVAKVAGGAEELQCMDSLVKAFADSRMKTNLADYYLMDVSKFSSSMNPRTWEI